MCKVIVLLITRKFSTVDRVSNGPYVFLFLLTAIPYGLPFYDSCYIWLLTYWELINGFGFLKFRISRPWPSDAASRGDASLSWAIWVITSVVPVTIARDLFRTIIDYNTYLIHFGVVVTNASIVVL